MRKVHWNLYTAALARDAKARKAAAQPIEEEPAAGEDVDAGGEIARAEPPATDVLRAAGNEADAG